MPHRNICHDRYADLHGKPGRHKHQRRTPYTDTSGGIRDRNLQDSQLHATRADPCTCDPRASFTASDLATLASGSHVAIEPDRATPATKRRNLPKYIVNLLAIDLSTGVCVPRCRE